MKVRCGYTARETRHSDRNVRANGRLWTDSAESAQHRSHRGVVDYCGCSVGHHKVGAEFTSRVPANTEVMRRVARDKCKRIEGNLRIGLKVDVVQAHSGHNALVQSEQL